MAKDERFKRFVVTILRIWEYCPVIEIWVDTFTGVNYIFCMRQYAGGLTVLVDKDGKPVVTVLAESKGKRIK